MKLPVDIITVVTQKRGTAKAAFLSLGAWSNCRRLNGTNQCKFPVIRSRLNGPFTHNAAILGKHGVMELDRYPAQADAIPLNTVFLNHTLSHQLFNRISHRIICATEQLVQFTVTHAAPPPLPPHSSFHFNTSCCYPTPKCCCSLLPPPPLLKNKTKAIPPPPPPKKKREKKKRGWGGVKGVFACSMTYYRPSCFPINLAPSHRTHCSCSPVHSIFVWHVKASPAHTPWLGDVSLGTAPSRPGLSAAKPGPWPFPRKSFLCMQ